MVEKVTLAVVSFIVGFDITLSLLYYHTHWVWWLQVGLAVLGGVVLLGLSFWFYRVGLFLLGAVSGIVIVAVVLSMKDEAMFGAWKYAVFAGAAILLGVAAVLLERPLTIFATSVFGAYLVVASVSFFMDSSIHAVLQDVFRNDFHNVDATWKSWILLGNVVPLRLTTH